MRIINNLAELQTVRGDWKKLAQRHGTPLLDWEWMSACAEAFYQPNQLFVIIHDDGTEVNAIVPLFRHEDNGVQKLEIIGTPSLGEPAGLLYRDHGALTALLHNLLKQGLPISLRRIEEGSESLTAIEKVFQYHSLHSLREGGASPWIDINSDWETFESRLSGKRRSDMRRALRRAGKMGRVDIRVHAVNPADVDNLLAEVFRVEAANWKGRNGSSLLHREDLAHFYTIYSHKAAQNGTLRVGTLSIDDTVVAVLLGLEEAGRFWVFKIGYDEKYARSSPGILLMHRCIEYAFKQKLTSFEFLGWDARWMHVWTDKVRRFKSPLIYPFSGHGLLGFARDSVGYLKNKLMVHNGEQ